MTEGWGGSLPPAAPVQWAEAWVAALESSRVPENWPGRGAGSGRTEGVRPGRTRLGRLFPFTSPPVCCRGSRLASHPQPQPSKICRASRAADALCRPAERFRVQGSQVRVDSLKSAAGLKCKMAAAGR